MFLLWNKVTAIVVILTPVPHRRWDKLSSQNI